MNHKNEIGFVDWEFIHDMQGIVPELITPEIISLTKEFLNKIPGKWNKIKSKLAKHVDQKQTVYVAISDIENLGNEFKIRGILKDKKGDVLSFHRVVVYDEDRFEDDYIGAVITDENGNFTLSFGKKTFSDFGLESEPDIYLKIFFWENGRFHEMGKVMPEIFEKSETREEKKIIEFGVVVI
jgi:hypothetical protein